jgi:hypothetical protein
LIDRRQASEVSGMLVGTWRRVIVHLRHGSAGGRSNWRK